jgi:hypothetical protein
MSTRHFLRTVVLLSFLTACAGREIYPESGRADQLFDQIIDCGGHDPEVPFQTKCRKKFENVEFTVRVDSVKTLGVTYFTLFAEMGDPNQMVNCSLRGSRQRALVDALNKGEITRLRGTPSRISFGEVNFIHFEECEIANK